MNGYVAEGPGANVFYEKDGRLFTPAKEISARYNKGNCD